jgi:hypothetical protein
MKTRIAFYLCHGFVIVAAAGWTEVLQPFDAEQAKRASEIKDPETAAGLS